MRRATAYSASFGAFLLATIAYAAPPAKLYPACPDDLCGYISEDWRFVIPPTFTVVTAFREARALVALMKSGGSEAFGYIDEQGHPCGAIEWDAPVSATLTDDDLGFSDGLGVVRKGEKWGFLGLDGKLKIPLRFDEAEPFSEGVAAVRLAGKAGFIDRTGRFVIPAQFDLAFGFREGLALIRVNEKYGFINKTGKPVIPPRFEFAFSFSEGLAPVQVGEFPHQKWGFIDRAGRFVVEPRYLMAEPFSEGLAAVELPTQDTLRTNYGAWGFIDHEGTLRIPANFGYVRGFNCGLAAAWPMDAWDAGYVDTTGNWVVSPAFGSAGHFDCAVIPAGTFESEPAWSSYITPSGIFVWCSH